MSRRIKIALYVPGKETEGRYFSLSIKKRLEIEPAIFLPPRKIIIISDINNDFRYLRRILVKNGIIDRNYRWIWGEGHLVIIGNYLSQNIKDLECLWLIYSLEDKARTEGGYVHFILSEDEVSVLQEKLIIHSPKYAKEASLVNKSYVMLYDGHGEIYRWLQTKNAVERIGDILFLSDEALNLDRDFFISLLAEANNKPYLSIGKWNKKEGFLNYIHFSTFNEVFYLGVNFIIVGRKYNGGFVLYSRSGMNEGRLNLISEQKFDTIIIKDGRFSDLPDV